MLLSNYQNESNSILRVWQCEKSTSRWNFWSVQLLNLLMAC